MTARNKLIQLVHIGAAKAFADDDTRRAWQQDRTGHASCRDMTTPQLQALADELRQKGALASRPPKRAGRKPFNRSPYMAKVEALLADMGLSWQYAEGIAWRLTGGRGLAPHAEPGVKRLEWVRDERTFRGLIAALEAEQTKRHLMGQIVEHLRVLDLPLAHVDSLVSEKLAGHKWQRNIPALQHVAPGPPDRPHGAGCSRAAIMSICPERSTPAKPASPQVYSTRCSSPAPA